jgi:hypothetical protein
MPPERQERIQAFTACLRELLRPHVSKNACLVNGRKIQDLITDGKPPRKVSDEFRQRKMPKGKF